MKCEICNKEIATTVDKFFMIVDEFAPTANNVPDICICDECAVTTTIMDLFMKNCLNMVNAEDDVIEIEAFDVKEPENSEGDE